MSEYRTVRAASGRRDSLLVADTRYTRLLRRLAAAQMERLEAIHGDCD